MEIKDKYTQQRIKREVYASLMMYQDARYKEDGLIFPSFSELVAEILRENKALKNIANELQKLQQSN